ncbi:LOW QUALITY PROTEIN: uncharacterized protein CELE_W02A2.12 [Caenorhabditis elegans]|uniref:Uncharacterized protein n=1 Tax=Caenorhabditis elegans TaxID=6239 RepID=A0A679KSC9_CAEEL|nr:LOW QUALITY PROTEIN: Uncharacterized protein CELE_W02A2.12 [Caenorhabditis elegans]CAA9876632.1 LOW QUALITY PROTEIN: Uncharacterized protein CELE_W02A2.12 [Caenorhabditis elegans]
MNRTRLFVTSGTRVVPHPPTRGRGVPRPHEGDE